MTNLHNIVKWPNGVHNARFLKYAQPFYNIMHERVKVSPWMSGTVVNMPLICSLALIQYHLNAQRSAAGLFKYV